jgi:subfamily B ATP-binding cassette protein MsbA
MAQIRRLIPYIRPHTLILLAALLLVSASGILEASIIMLLEPVFNLLSGSFTQEVGATAPYTLTFSFLQDLIKIQGPQALGLLAFLLVAISFLKGSCLYAAEYMMAYVGQKVVAQLRNALYARLLDQSLSFYSGWPTGQLMSRVISDTEKLQEAVSKTVTDFARQIFLFISFMAIVFYIDWKLSVLAISIGPLVLFLTLKMGTLVRRVSWASQEKISELSDTLQETITGQRIVKAFGMEDYEQTRFEKLSAGLVKLNLRLTRINALSSPLMEFLGYLLFVPFLLYANLKIGSGASAGAFIAFVVALFKLYEPVRKLSRMHLYFEQAFACSSRIFELLDIEMDIKEEKTAITLQPLKSQILFNNVTFSYTGKEPGEVLNRINLTIDKGAVVALVGRSGAGKTTVASLLPRFYDVTGGAITFDETDIRSVTLSSLRNQIAMVTQETLLFNDTVRNNIGYGRLEAGQNEIEEAARAALIHDFIVSLPEGYQTVIGERGERLSGGQRQRIAIARAILKKSPVLILDEATSSLDSQSEALVQKALQHLMNQCTTLVIAHRMSTIRKADCIVVMQKGEIIETGDHETLISRSGLYKELYEMQETDQPES